MWSPFKNSAKNKVTYDVRFETSQVAECLDLIGHANPTIQRDILRRLSRAISLLLKDFPLPNDATFAELKRSLRSDQASAIGMHVSKIGSAIAANLKGGNQYNAAVDEMIFMLIGASLSRTILPEYEQSIDQMIAMAEEANL